VNNIERYLVFFLFSVVVILIAMQVVFRFGINYSLDWTEELARYFFVASIYIGASIAIRENGHIRVEAIFLLLSKRGVLLVRCLADVISLLFCILMTYLGFIVSRTLLAAGQTSATLELPMGMVYAVIPVGFAIMSLRLVGVIYASLLELRHFHTGGAAARG
jgi:TRAP-type C4-dicarboxylate transport system permease small subunit